jgi:CHAT domain-containing protein/pimeloyl-ACP methyl ester carboxylesterase
METLKIRITGEKRIRPTELEDSETLSLEETYAINTTTRGEVDNRHIVNLDESKVIQFTYEDNTVWVGNLNTIDEIFPGTSTQVRSVENGEDTIVEIPTEVFVGESNRGIFSKIALKFISIFSKKVADPLIRTSLKDLAIKLDNKQSDNITGLFQLTTDFKLAPPKVVNGGNYLLFIHGTISSAQGAFMGLLGTPVWSFITQTYPGRVLAFQHKTLTQSPLDNVLDLVKALPQTATLTLISHSRGGLVGDILSRFCVANPAKRGFSANEKNFLQKQNRTDDLQRIEAIEAVMLGKNITIGKFIRVAATASGTTLLSHRLDIYFNVIANVIGLASGLGVNPAFGIIKDLIATALKDRNDVSVLPGLEVQSPSSPFNQILNNANPDPSTLIESPLIVISGDAKMSFRWQAIKVALTNLFFLGDNDFVVDTRSMYNGVKYADNKVQYFFDQGADVSHSNYFVNDRTRNALLLALRNTGETLIPGFAKLDTRAFSQEEIRNISSLVPGGKVTPVQVSGKKPIVVLLPGIMGSTLTVSDKSIWINFFSFIGGGLTSLFYSDDNNRNVKADGVVASSYKKIVDSLSRDYDVVVFPFDWRLNMVANAAALDRKLIELQQLGQPIKLIGHSMGGVLIRDYIVNHTDNWKKLQASQGFRLLFLGAPLGGSFRIPYVLFGLDSLIHTLDFVDVTHSKKDLLAVFSQFPGILSLLPLTTDAKNDFAKRATWERMRKAFGDDEWPIPNDDLLTEFGNYRDKVLAKTDSPDFTKTLSSAVYIAGQARQNQQTISGFTTDNDELTFFATKEGDESVTWESGIPKPMIAQNTVYYSDVTHGELANAPKLFGAITELLNTGFTSQLKRTRPVLRSLDKEFKARTIYDFDLSPTGVEKSLMGLGVDERFTAGDVPITVSVSNGDLKYAMYPVMAGHFENDGIQNAERSIDQYLGNELSRRHQLGLYPGVFGTSEEIISDTTQGFRGAVIVGLGEQGMFTEFRLAKAVEQGTINYLANLNSKSTAALNKNLMAQHIGISALVIGSGYGGLRIENSIRAIIQGVQNANAKIRQIYTAPTVIDTIEFVELYKDKALTCIKAVSAIEKDESRSLNIFRNGNRIKKLTGWRERLPVDDTTEWWTRINVSRDGAEDDSTNSQRNLQFEISTNAARVEQQSLTTINDTLTGMLEDLSRNDEWSPELAKAIFELMIPNNFKDQVKRQNNINWILDSYTAAFPWELLQDSVINARPLSINAGMIRQLATGNARINITPVVESTAIVIGDPDLNNPALQLQAARNEGRKIADLLKTQGYDVNPLVGTKASQILLNLFSKNYKIVHLAGHGVFHKDPSLPTGMLIGEGAYLTPAYIKQMSNVPELVFVNCCYLGQMDGAAESFSQSRLGLAANIGTQLIEIGVKAVVVAGWAVNDSAALDFAELFYQYMFERYNFGEAIKKARLAIFEKYGPRNNTWGAYQAYGDPYYKLTNKSRPKSMTYDFVIPEEAEIELGNLLNRVESGGYDSEEIMQKMDAIDKALVQADLSSSRIIELQALLFSALNMYEQAVAKFSDLWKEEKASYSFSATEKFCNTKVKLYAQQVKKAGKSNPALSLVELAKIVKEATDALNEVIVDLEGLNRFGVTVERIDILASTYKRLAIISTGKDKQNAYECSAAKYRQAYEIPDNKTKFYPLINWLSIENALVQAGIRAWNKNNLPTKAKAQKDLDAELENIQRKTSEEKEYWDWIVEATLLLCKRLLGDTKITDDNILAQYTTAWLMIGAQGQHQTEIEHLEFLEDALSMNTSDKTQESLGIVRKVKMTLEGMA